MPSGGQSVPSHRADTPADAPTILASRPSGGATQRRRDLRAHGRTSAPRAHGAGTALAWLDAADQGRPARPAAAGAAAPLSRREIHSRAAGGRSTAVLERGSGSTSSFGALALDPLFVT